jgi:toxin FitB
MYVFDTNVLSEIRKSDRADPNLTRWVRAISSSVVFVSAITVFELEISVGLMERRDAAQGAVLRRWFDTLLDEFSERILPVDAEVARLCGTLHVPNKKATNDSLIAATAIVAGKIVVTRNIKDFAPMGVTVLNPFDVNPVPQLPR